MRTINARSVRILTIGRIFSPHIPMVSPGSRKIRSLSMVSGSSYGFAGAAPTGSGAAPSSTNVSSLGENGVA